MDGVFDVWLTWTPIEGFETKKVQMKSVKNFSHTQLPKQRASKNGQSKGVKRSSGWKSGRQGQTGLECNPLTISWLACRPPLLLSAEINDSVHIWISIFLFFLRAHDPVCCQLFHYWPPLPTSASVTPLVWNQLQIHIFSLNFFISPKIDFRIQRHTYNGEMWIVRDPFGALADLLCGVIQRRLHFFL